MQALTRQTLKIFWQHTKPYKTAFWLIVILLLGTIAVDAISPFWYKKLFNLLALNDLRLAQNLVLTAAIIAAFALARSAMWRTILILNARLQPRVMSDLLNTCFEYLHNHSYEFFQNSFVGSLVTKVRRYQKSYETIFDQAVYNIGRTFTKITVIFSVMLWVHWPLGLAVLTWALIYISLAYAFSRYRFKFDARKAQKDTQTTALLADTIGNNFSLKLFNAQNLEYKNFKKTTDALYQAFKKSWDIGNNAEAVQSLAMIVFEFVMLYLAVQFWKQGILTLGDFAVIQSYLLQMFDNLWDFGKNLRGFYEALADSEEMTEVLLKPHEISNAPGAGVLKTTHGEIKFQNVSFNYSGNLNILDNFSLTIKPGERVALIGPSGGGKSTIVKLLFRFYDISGGQILIDGQNIAKVTQDSLRAALTLVPQEPTLFHRSLMENIRYARIDAGDDEVMETARMAHAHEFISAFPEGYKTLVGERGIKLSGGERQRVAIARAILKNAPILILDEATSSLDSESEMFIQDSLHALMRNRTTIVIAHRLSTIMQMDRIVVIDGGKIVEEGRHEELLKVQQGLYQKLWGIQAGSFASFQSG